MNSLHKHSKNDYSYYYDIPITFIDTAACWHLLSVCSAVIDTRSHRKPSPNTFKFSPKFTLKQNILATCDSHSRYKHTHALSNILSDKDLINLFISFIYLFFFSIVFINFSSGNFKSPVGKGDLSFSGEWSSIMNIFSNFLFIPLSPFTVCQ